MSWGVSQILLLGYCQAASAQEWCGGGGRALRPQLSNGTGEHGLLCEDASGVFVLWRRSHQTLKETFLFCLCCRAFRLLPFA